jgi:death-on-curing protein
MSLATEELIHFLTLEEVLVIHQNQMPQAAQLDERQLGQLRACLALPAAKHGGGYSHRDLFEMAGAYLFHLVHNRPFSRGNRRVAALSALFFLFLHDIEIESDPNDLAALTQEVARNQATLRTVAEFLRAHARPTV